jgi:hypothetical protein
MVAVAGVAAEECWGGGDLDDLCEFLDGNAERMSPSDWKLSGCPYGKPSKRLFDAMEEVYELLNNETGEL